MAPSLGRVVARLAEPSEVLPASMVDLINSNIKPPTQVEPGDVYVRAMYIVSDQVNSFGGRFPEDEHARLAELLIDSPVLIGHRKDKLPVGRNFHAEKVTRDNHPWVKSYFYWLRSSDDAAQLRDNIDGGIYKECSVAFTFGLPECSICGRDIRRCEHEPFEDYEVGGERHSCHFNYRQIERVLETSLVYRGAVPKTAIAKELSDTTGDNVVEPTTIRDLRVLASDREYLILPVYDGLLVNACSVDDGLGLSCLNGEKLYEVPFGHYHPKSFRPTESVTGMLVGYRGRERCSPLQLEEYLKHQSGPVSRLRFNLFPGQGIVSLTGSRKKSLFDVRLIPHRLGKVEQVARLAREIGTRDGVELWDLPTGGGPFDPTHSSRLHYLPPPQSEVSPERYELHQSEGNASGELRLFHSSLGSDPVVFRIPGFDLERFGRGARFVAHEADRPALSSGGKVGPALSGRLSSMTVADSGYIGDSEGDLAGTLVLRPIRLEGRDSFLFYNLAAGASYAEA
jgi:hypothetical protein